LGSYEIEKIDDPMHLTQAKLTENINNKDGVIQMVNQKKIMPKPGNLPDTRMFRQIRKKNGENISMSVPPSTGNRSILNSSNQKDSDYSVFATPDVTQQPII